MPRVGTLAVVAGLCAVACGGGKGPDEPDDIKCPQGQVYDGRYCVAAGGQGGNTAYGGSGYGGSGYGAAGAGAGGAGAGGAGAAASGASGAGASAGAGGTLGGVVFQPGPTAQALPPGSAALVDPMLAPLVAAHAPGGKPVGEPLAGQFATGQSLQMTFQAQPGSCYSVIAAGAPGVTNVDVRLMMTTPIPGGSPVLATDATVEATAAIGAGADCYRWAFPAAMPVTLVLSVSGGQGVAAARVLTR